MIRGPNNNTGSLPYKITQFRKNQTLSKENIDKFLLAKKITSSPMSFCFESKLLCSGSFFS